MLLDCVRYSLHFNDLTTWSSIVDDLHTTHIYSLLCVCYNIALLVPCWYLVAATHVLLSIWTGVAYARVFPNSVCLPALLIFYLQRRDFNFCFTIIFALLQRSLSSRHQLLIKVKGGVNSTSSSDPLASIFCDSVCVCLYVHFTA